MLKEILRTTFYDFINTYNPVNWNRNRLPSDSRVNEIQESLELREEYELDHGINLWKKNDGTYHIYDGSHRIAAAKRLPEAHQRKLKITFMILTGTENDVKEHFRIINGREQVTINQLDFEDTRKTRTWDKVGSWLEQNYPVLNKKSTACKCPHYNLTRFKEEMCNTNGIDYCKDNIHTLLINHLLNISNVEGKDASKIVTKLQREKCERFEFYLFCLSYEDIRSHLKHRLLHLS